MLDLRAIALQLAGKMKTIFFVAPLFPATLVLAATACAQLSPDDALKAFQHGPDVRVELVAAEPLVMSPCAMAFDERGRLFVAENRGSRTPPIRRKAASRCLKTRMPTGAWTSAPSSPTASLFPMA